MKLQSMKAAVFFAACARFKRYWRESDMVFLRCPPLLTAIFINDCAIFMIDEIIRHGIFDVRNCRYEVAGICVSSVSAGLEGKYWREADESKEEKIGSMEICGRGRRRTVWRQQKR